MQTRVFFSLYLQCEVVVNFGSMVFESGKTSKPRWKGKNNLFLKKSFDDHSASQPKFRKEVINPEQFTKALDSSQFLFINDSLEDKTVDLVHGKFS